MVSVASDTIDRVAGLEAGADDYIAKPVRAQGIVGTGEECVRRAASVATGELSGPRVTMGRRVLDLERRLLLGHRRHGGTARPRRVQSAASVRGKTPNRPVGAATGCWR